MSRRRQEAQRKNEPQPAALLREFIYLDETSVQSLASSAGQALLVGLTETAGTSAAKSRQSQVGAGKGVFRFAFKRNRDTGEHEQSQVEAKYNIQATFAKLRDRLRPNLSLGPSTRQPTTPDQTTAPADLSEALAQWRATSTAIPVTDLRRGSLVEVEVRLNAHPLYELGSLSASVSSVVKAAPRLAGGSGVEMVQDVSAIFDHMLGDLIPVDGTATSHIVLTHEGVDWVVPREASEPFVGEAKPRPLGVVGVMEREKFWRDPRRVLFEDLEFTSMGRATHSGLREEWSPSKWFGPMNRLVPELMDALKEFELDSSDGSDADDIATVADYIQALASHFSAVVPPNDIEALATLVLSSSGSSTGNHLATILQAMDVAASLRFAGELSLADPDEIAGIRENVLEHHHLLLPSQLGDPTTSVHHDDRLLLELDFIAGYW